MPDTIYVNKLFVCCLPTQPEHIEVPVSGSERVSCHPPVPPSGPLVDPSWVQDKKRKSASGANRARSGETDSLVVYINKIFRWMLVLLLGSEAEVYPAVYVITTVETDSCYSHPSSV